jgi:hypothetical protein
MGTNLSRCCNPWAPQGNAMHCIEALSYERLGVYYLITNHLEKYRHAITRAKGGDQKSEVARSKINNDNVIID